MASSAAAPPPPPPVSTFLGSASASPAEPGLSLGLEGAQAAALAQAPLAERPRRLAALWGTDELQTARRLAEACRLPLVLDPVADEETLGALPARLFTEFLALPLPGAPAEASPAALAPLHLATAWPPERHYGAWIYAVSGRSVQWSLAPAERIVAQLTARFGVGFSSLDTDDGPATQAAPEEEASEDGDAAVIRFVNELVQRAISDEATDIHLEPQEKALRIRYRIDGELVNVPMPENLRQFQDAIISRLKIMAHLNISEKRLPQDGRINFKLGEHLVDIRISTIPTLYAESVSLRLLTSKKDPLSLAQLGLLPNEQAAIDKVLAYPHGIVLATGPTGSGKSTSLNSFINRINTPDKRIITIEDPVEYEVPGVNQIQVRPEIGLDFASGLRNILRQDPDVIMVGEIRDRETADIAIRASLTGHLVFSTLHTNDAAGALTRLIDMGVEPFLVASAVELVIAQRLVRRLCPHCRTMRPVPHARLLDQLKTLEIPEPELAVARIVAAQPESSREPLLATPVGCPRCRHLGYRGRVGIFEILRVDDRLHDLILSRQSAHAFSRCAREAGMRTLAQAGWEQVLLGTTTLEEVIGATAMES